MAKSKILLGLGLCLAMHSATADDSAPAKAWEHYKQHFISQDGRVIDIYQSRVSHSEGQGYGMLLAERFNDRRLFDTLWNWTRNNLQARRDGLLAWNWGQRPNGQWNVIDYNTASDGDLLVAFALARAGQRWQAPAYTDEARRLAKALRENVAAEQQGISYLLTGYYGYADEKGGLVLNPAYQIPSAYRAMGELDDKAFWEKVEQGGATLWQAACDNPSGLPADWLAVRKGKAGTDEGHPAHFGYEAIRVYLYADWLEPYQSPCGGEQLLERYRKDKRLAPWYGLDGKTASKDEASAGYYAIASRLAERLGRGEEAKKLRETADKQIAWDPDGYYAYSLYLLAVAPR